MIKRPEQINIRRDGTVQLWFDLAGPTDLDGAYFLRGGLCWPGETTRAAFEENMSGFAVVAGIRSDRPDPRQQKIEILAEQAFTTCANIVERDRIVSPGLAPWMARALGDFGCKTWYAQRGTARGDTFLRDIRRCGLEIAKHTAVLDVDETLEACIGMLVDAQNERRLGYAAGGEVHQALRDYKASEGMAIHPALAATARLCAGLRKRPPRIRQSGLMEIFRPE